MEEQQALFETIQLADGTIATAAEVKLIDAITQEAKRYREEIIKRLIQFSPQIAPELAKTTEELPIRYKFFLNSKTGIQLIRLLGGADLALELIREKPQTPKRKIYPLGQIQQFFWILYYVTANTPQKMLPQTTDIIGDALTELHFNKAKNPWTKVCFKATNTKLCDAIITIIDANFEKIMAEKKASPELLQAAEQYHETLHKLLLDFKTASTEPTKNTLQTARKMIIFDNTINKVFKTAPKPNTNGEIDSEIEIIGTALPAGEKRNRNTKKIFAAEQINKRIVILIPKEAGKNTPTKHDFLNIRSEEIFCYVSGKVITIDEAIKKGKQVEGIKYNIQGKPLIPVTPTEIYRAIHRNPNANPTPTQLQEITQELEKMNSGLECRVFDEDEAKVTKQPANTASYLPILKYHFHTKDNNSTDGKEPRTDIYYYTDYVSPFVEYLVKKKYLTIITGDKTIIYKINDKKEITTNIAQISDNRMKVISYLEKRVLNKNLTKTIKLTTLFEEIQISDRKEQSRIKKFIPTILENFKQYKHIKSYKITDTTIRYTTPKKK